MTSTTWQPDGVEASSTSATPTSPPQWQGTAAQSTTHPDAFPWIIAEPPPPATTTSDPPPQSYPQRDDAPEEPNKRPRRAACVACRQRKVRCSGQTPTCQRCARFGHNCVYKAPGVAGPKPLPQVLRDVKSRLC